MALAFYSIDSEKIDSTLTNFPVGIKVDVSTGFMSGLGATDWQNLHATVGGTECYVEVESWDISGDIAILWVRVPSVSSTSDTVIKLATGSLNTSYVGETGDTAAQTVWDSNFDLVMHLSQDPSGGTDCMLDSTSNANHATPNGSMTSGDLVTGLFNKAINFDGLNDYLITRYDHAITGSQNRTITHVIRTNNNVDDMKSIMFGVLTTYNSYSSMFAGSGLYRIAINGGNRVWAGTYADSEWHVISFIQNGTDTSDIRSFFDGVEVTPSSTSDQTINTSTSKYYIGALYDSGSPDNFFEGDISNVRTSDTARSEAWIKAECHTLKNSLLTYSDADPINHGIGFSESIGRTVESIRGITENISFNELIDGSSNTIGPQPQSIGLSETIGRSIIYTRGIAYSLGLSDIIACNTERSRSVSGQIDFTADVSGFNYSAWLRMNLSRAVYRYFSKITGSADSLDDYTFQNFKSFQLRMRTDVQSYVSIVLDYNDDALTAISNRPNGSLVIDMTAFVDGVESLREELIRTSLYSCRYDLGGNNGSITLVGYGDIENSGSRVILSGVQTKTMLADGRMQFRCARPDFYLKPGDTAVYDPYEIIVGQISASISPVTQSMDVQEAG